MRAAAIVEATVTIDPIEVGVRWLNVKRHDHFMRRFRDRVDNWTGYRAECGE
jgi:hypothetical protein